MTIYGTISKFGQLLSVFAVLGLTVGCTNHLPRAPTAEEASVASSINHILQRIGEPALCPLESGADEEQFRMIEWPFRGPMRIVSVHAALQGGVVSSMFVSVKEDSAGGVSVQAKSERQIDEAAVSSLWQEIDASRVWGRRTNLSDVEDGKYVVFEAIDPHSDCDLVILLSPDSAGVLKLMSHLGEVAEQLAPPPQ